MKDSLQNTLLENIYKPAHPCFLIKIHNTHQREIKNLLLKTNNKRNTTIGNSLKKVIDR